MGFHFGILGNLDGSVTTAAFIAVVVFLYSFEWITGLVEYLVSENVLYSQILQRIYKELMLMGIVSFTVLMVESDSRLADAQTTWIQSIDFCHIVLFYVAIFFVLHAFYIMTKSYRITKDYIYTGCMKLPKLVEEIERNTFSPIGQFLFGQRYLPLSMTREQAELKIVSRLFIDAYKMPLSFDVASYLSDCFGNYALKIISRGILSWGVLIVLSLLNFMRLKLGLGFNCTANPSDTALIENPLDPKYDKRRVLSSGNIENLGQVCYAIMIQLFFMMGALLMVYTAILFTFSNIYRIRLLMKAGVDNASDYKDFLCFVDSKTASLQSSPTPVRASSRRTFEALKEEVVDLLDEQETNEDDLFYRHVVEHLSLYYSYFLDIFVESVRTIRRLVFSRRFNAVSPTQSVIFLGGRPNSLPRMESMSNRERFASDDDEGGQLTANRSLKREVSVGRNTRRERFLSKQGNLDGSSSNGGSSDNILRRLSSSLLRRMSGDIRGNLSPQHAEQTTSQSGKPLIENASKLKNEVAKGPSSTDTQPSITTTDVMSHSQLSNRTDRPQQNTSSRASDMMLADFDEGEISNYDHPTIRVANDSKTVLSLSASKGNHSSIVSDALTPFPTPTNSVGSSTSKTILSQTNPSTDHKQSSSSAQRLPDRKQSVAERRPLKNNSPNALKPEPASVPSKSALEQPYNRRRKSVVEALADILPSTIAHNHKVAASSRRNSLLALDTTRAAAPDHDNILEMYWKTKQERLLEHETIQPSRLSKWVGACSPAAYHIQLTDDFDNIFLFKRPWLFYRAIEVGLMFNCLYISMWATNFLYVVEVHTESTLHGLWHFLMLIPILFVMPALGNIAKTSSLLQAISDPDFAVIKEVLDDMEDRLTLKRQVRKKVLARMRSSRPDADLRTFVNEVFSEIDADRSGSIDKYEFRDMLRALNLHYSDERFRRLWKAVDINGTGKLELQGMFELLFPSEGHTRRGSSTGRARGSSGGQTVAHNNPSDANDNQNSSGDDSSSSHSSRNGSDSSLGASSNVDTKSTNMPMAAASSAGLNRLSAVRDVDEEEEEYHQVRNEEPTWHVHKQNRTLEEGHAVVKPFQPLNYENI